MKKKILILGCTMLLTILITGCQTPSQNVTKRPDTMGSATSMLNGHRRTKKKPDDNIQKIIGASSVAALLSGTYFILEKRKRG